VGNVLFFRVSGKDSSELTSVFNNTPPPPELERQPMLHPTSTQGVFRTGDNQIVLAPGKARLYTDVAAERANHLANLPNFVCCCRLVVGQALQEYEVAACSVIGTPNPDQAGQIRQNSRLRFGRDRMSVEEGLKIRGASTLPTRSRFD
jgi:hypothetical protein